MFETILTGPTKIAVFGLGTVGIVSLVMMLVQKFLKKSKADIERETKHVVKQEQTEEKIKTITKEQEVLAKQVEVAESAAEDSKKKVKEIMKKASQEITETLKQDSIVKIDQQIEDDWSDL